MLYEFIPHIDNFNYISGVKPILIVGSHTHSDQSEEEKSYHLCDYAVSPIIERLRELNKYYFLKNNVPRSIVDMNRLEARLKDEIDTNDFVFRQMIRYTLNYIHENYKRIPMLIDLHSYDSNDNWNSYDIMILEQTKKGMQTNKGLIRFSKNFFNNRGWRIESTTQHNQDDVVEEIAFKNLAIPILIEINEAILRSPKFDKLISDLDQYLETIDAKNNYQDIKDVKFDRKQELIEELNSITIDMLDEERRKLPNIHDPILREAYKNYIFQLIEYKKYQNISNIKSQTSDSMSNATTKIDSISSLHLNVGKISDNGNDDKNLVYGVIYSLSNEYNSLIIPIELVILNVKIMYSSINKTSFQEWGINPDSLINMLLTIAENEEYPIMIPFLRKEDNETIFKSYQVESNPAIFIKDLILISNYTNISEKGIQDSLSYINQKFSKSLEYLITIDQLKDKQKKEKIISDFSEINF